MIPVQLSTAEISDIEALKGVPENRSLEYKQELHLNTDSEKKEFLADVSSFANTSGGDIIYGLVKEEVDGKPTGCFADICGITTSEIDTLKLQMESILGSCVKPRFPFYEIEAIPMTDRTRSVLVLRFRKSFLAPHRVDYGNSKRFYGRNSAGKYELEVEELRAAFSLGDALDKKIHERWKNFIIPLSIDPLLNGKPIIALQLLPSNVFEESEVLDLKKVHENHDLRIQTIHPIRQTLVKFNFEGFWRGYEDGEGVSFIQLHHTGEIQTVSDSLLEETEDGRILQITPLEEKLIEKLLAYTSFLEENLRNALPAFLSLSLIHVQGVFVPDNHLPYLTKRYWRVHPIENSDLHFPTITIEQLPKTKDEAAQLLRPTFDRLWSSIGVPRSPNFTEDGRRHIAER